MFTLMTRTGGTDMEKYQAAAYLRLSVAGSRAIESESLENQEYIINHFIAENQDILLAGSYADSGHSGLVFDRPAFSQMMKDAKAGKINCIIVKDLSRFGRDFIETGRYLQRILPSHGIRFIAVLDNVDTLHKPARDDIVMQIKTAINDEVSREISMKTRSGLLTMRESGLYVGACPIYGYQKSVDNKNQLVLDNNTAPIVSQIFNLKLAGMSAARIAAQLNQDCILSPLAYKKKMGLPHPCNGFADKDQSKWSASTVLRILKDEIYTGTLVQGKQYKLNYKIQKYFTRPTSEWERCEKAHDGIINIYDFEAVQRILLMDTRTPPGGDIVGLFSGLLICGCCGGNMTRKTRKCGNTVYRYYYCPTGKRQGFHAPVMIAEDTLIDIVFKEMWHYALNAQSLSKQLKLINDDEIHRLLIKDKRAFIENAQEQLLQLRVFQSSLATSSNHGIIDEVERADMDVMYTQESLHLEAEISEVSAEVQILAAHIDEHIQWIANIAEIANHGSFERADIVRLIKGITILAKSQIIMEFFLDI